MESFAFWYHDANAENKNGQKSVCNDSSPTGSPIDTSTRELSAVMNFNLWCECGWNDRSIKNRLKKKEFTEYPFLDIGFRINNLDLADELYFFLPLQIDEKNKLNFIQDLGRKYTYTPLVDATFNKSYATTISAGKKTITASCDKPTDNFLIYQLDIEHDIELTKFSDGTILSIKTAKILNNLDTPQNSNTAYYFRFRVKDCPLDFLIHRYSSPHKVIQTLFTTTYMIDFRYQNIRSLQNTLIEKFNSDGNHVVNVTSLHFLLITKAYVDVSCSTFKDIRKLEHNVWEEYVDDLDTTDLVAYHYADKANKKTNQSQNNEEENSGEKYIDSSELFVKFKMECSFLIKYFLFTLTVGALGSCLSSIAIWLFSIEHSLSDLLELIKIFFADLFG